MRTGRCIAKDIGPEHTPFVRSTSSEPEKNVPEQSDDVRSKKQQRNWQPLRLPRQKPTIYSLPCLEALARGEAASNLGGQFDTENDSDRSRWRTPRERIGPVSNAELLLWTVLERWDFKNVDGWEQLLKDSLEEDDGLKIGEELKPALKRFASSTIRSTLAAAVEKHRNVEFLVDLASISDSRLSCKVRGLIDLLYRDAKGWHILGIDFGAALKEDGWHGRQPGLVLQAWSASKQFGDWPLTISLFDLATGQLVEADPRQFPIEDVTRHFLRTAGIID